MKSRDRGMNNGKDILVVEDSATQREQIRHLLESHGFRVTTAADGKKAFENVQAHPPTLVVSDIVMPEMDGFALCKEIKSSDTLRDIPVILLTSLSGPQDVIKGLESGADNFIRKPFDEKYLVSRVDYIIANRKLRKSDKLQMGVELFLGGKRHFITAERQQILDLLISTYEQAVHLNEELKLREQQVARGNEILKCLYQIAKRLNQAVSEERMIDEVLEGALALPGLKADWICLVEGESGFRAAAARSLPEPLNQPGALAGDCLCRRMLLSGELQRATIMPKCERLVGKDGKLSNIDSHVSVPLRAGGRALGVLNFITTRHSALTEDDLQTLNGIGNQIGTALERLRMQERLEQLVGERTAALTAEISERKRSEEELRRMEERYRTTLDHMMEGCQIIGQDFRYLYLNDVAVEHSRNTRGDLLGRNMTDVYPGIESSEMFASLKRCMSERIPLRLEYEFEYPDGLKSWFNLSFEPVPEGVFILSEDISEEKRLSEETKKYHEHLEDLVKERTTELTEANKELEAFSYSVSHDLRAPLRSIDGFSLALFEDYFPQLDDRAKDYVTRLRRATQSMGALIDDLLELSRVTRRELHADKVNMSVIAAGIAAELRQADPNRAVEFTAMPDLVIGGDAHLLRIMLVNLIGNAWKFTSRKPGAAIEFGRIQKAGETVFFVHDNGAGFDPKYIDKLFTPFQRLHNPEEFPGTGIGLATVQRIVRRHGGRVWAEGRVDDGATFFFTLKEKEIQ